jgi:D-serine deaminase-like pyridoxal phosphate-dependent protein
MRNGVLMWSNSRPPVSRHRTGTFTVCLAPSAMAVKAFVIGASEKHGYVQWALMTTRAVGAWVTIVSNSIAASALR